VGILPSTFKFVALSTAGGAVTAPPSLQAAFDRYTQIAFPLPSGDICGYLLPSLQVTVEDYKEVPPALGDNESYALAVPNDGSAATLRAGSIFGAMRGLETFAQLVDRNDAGQYGVADAPLDIRDAPAYPHRGLMIDAGRRFFPVPTVRSLLDGMAASKLNVLHLHASDNCRWSVESKLFPQLTAGLGPAGGDMAGFYTQADVRGLVAYARARGIRIVPEFDMPVS
jgi:hexosaminidase